MERERRPREAAPRPADSGLPDDELERIRAESEELVAAADQLLDSLHFADAEGFLQDIRQHGGQ